MSRFIRNGALAVGLVTALTALALPASAAPAMWGPAGIEAATNSATTVRMERKKQRKHRRGSHNGHHSRGHAAQGVDTVGSLGFDGHGYAYNRFSGQRYQSCVTDDGYGRVRPCDAGGGGRN